MLKWFCLGLLGFFSHKDTVDLAVHVSGFSSNSGQAYVAIFNKSEDFPNYGNQYRGKIVHIKDKQCKISFSQLTPGSYAVAVYHDQNLNNQLDKNILGIPTESYGFSNNARGTFSAPSFSEAKVQCFKNKTTHIVVK